MTFLRWDAHFRKDKAKRAKKVSEISEKDLILLFDCCTLIKLVIVFKRVKYREMLRYISTGEKGRGKRGQKGKERAAGTV